MATKVKSTHVIEDYSVSENTILCVCGWSGFTDDYPEHRKTAPPTTRKIEKDYGGDFIPRRKVTLNDILAEDYVA